MAARVGLLDRPLTRRAFLRVTALAGGGLLAACGGGSSDDFFPRNGNGPDPSPPTGNAWQPNSFIRITPDNRLTVIVASTEVGQGTLTAMPQIIADELDADWSLVGYEQAPADLRYASPALTFQITGQSATVSGYYTQHRNMAAAVRMMLVQAAAQRWGVDAGGLRTAESFVIHDASGRRASYGELATEAAQQPVPENPPLKDPSRFHIVGQSKQRLDASAKVDGSAIYASDIDLPGMLVALVAHAPRFGGQPLSFDAGHALAVPGVVSVFSIPLATGKNGVAVVARDFWAAKKGRDALRVQWLDAAAETRSSEQILQEYSARMGLPGEPYRNDGLVELAQLGAAQRLSADYRFPYLAHAPMEPLSTVIDYRGGSSAEVWCGSQSPTLDQLAIATVLGLPISAVKFNVTLAGGGFGRRLSALVDYAMEAAFVARELRVPVKVLWTREDDLRGGLYRNAAVCRLTATLDSTRNMTSYTHRIAGQGTYLHALVSELLLNGGFEFRLTQGAADFPYAVPNVRVDAHSMTSQVTVQWMRSVANSFNVYALEAFMDEVALAAGSDPYAFRRNLLANQPRHRAVLEAAAAAVGWNSAPAAGVHRGIAVFSSYGSYIAQVVEASVDAQRRLKIHRVLSAVDCGVAVNPDLIKAQIESAVIFALTSVLFGEITLRDGQVEQSNFHDYRLLRMYQAPEIETIILPSSEAPGGVGELGVPCVGPALANAIFGATGERIRTLPMYRQNLVIA